MYKINSTRSSRVAGGRICKTGDDAQQDSHRFLFFSPTEEEEEDKRRSVCFFGYSLDKSCSGNSNTQLSCGTARQTARSAGGIVVWAPRPNDHCSLLHDIIFYEGSQPSSLSPSHHFPPPLTLVGVCVSCTTNPPSPLATDVCVCLPPFFTPLPPSRHHQRRKRQVLAFCLIFSRAGRKEATNLDRKKQLMCTATTLLEYKINWAWRRH